MRAQVQVTQLTLAVTLCQSIPLSSYHHHLSFRATQALPFNRLPVHLVRLQGRPDAVLPPLRLFFTLVSPPTTRLRDETLAFAALFQPLCRMRQAPGLASLANEKTTTVDKIKTTLRAALLDIRKCFRLFVCVLHNVSLQATVPVTTKVTLPISPSVGPRRSRTVRW